MSAMSARKISNSDVAQLLKEIVACMEVSGANPFRIRAYRNAINSLETSTVSAYDLWKSGRLSDLEGIGPNLEKHLSEYFSTGHVKEFEAEKAKFPQGMFALLSVQGIGPKRAYKLAAEFELTDAATALEKLVALAKAGRIRSLPGFGEKSEQALLDAISTAKKTKHARSRILWYRGDALVQDITKYMRKLDPALHLEALGSYRRKRATLGDLDIAVASETPLEVMEHFLKYPSIQDVLVSGDKKSSVLVSSGVQVDFRVVSPKRLGSMLQYFTGSKQHNILLRTHALERGLSLSEYGIKDGEVLREFAEEQDLYEYLGLQFIPPELREGTTEIEVARKHALPKLLALEDIRGDLHMHTTASDGKGTILDMARKAKALGYAYIGISDHAPSVHSRGLDAVQALVMKTRSEIDLLNSRGNLPHILFGYEVNILATGELSLPESILEQLDYVIGGIHTSFGQSRRDLMHRFEVALSNPHLTFIAHPTARLLGSRSPLDVDWETFLDMVAVAGKFLEINSQPSRLDLPDDLVRLALERHIPLLVNTDAHDVASLEYMRYGVNIARRGWCESQNILNTLPLRTFLRKFKK